MDVKYSYISHVCSYHRDRPNHSCIYVARVRDIIPYIGSGSILFMIGSRNEFITIDVPSVVHLFYIWDMGFL